MEITLEKKELQNALENVVNEIFYDKDCLTEDDLYDYGYFFVNLYDRLNLNYTVEVSNEGEEETMTKEQYREFVDKYGYSARVNVRRVNLL